MVNVVQYTYKNDNRFDYVKNFINEKDVFDLYFDYPAAKTSHWFKNMPAHTSNIDEDSFKGKSMFKFAKNTLNKFLQKHGNISQANYSVLSAKRCPAIISFLSRCLVLKAPCDIVIEINKQQEKGIVVYNSNPKIFSVSGHHREQFFNEKAPLFGNYTNVKFAYPFVFKTNGLPCMFLAPQYHKGFQKKFEVLNASNDGHYTNSIALNLNTFVNLESPPLEIKAGEPLAYLWFPEKVKFEFTRDIVTTPLVRKFRAPGNMDWLVGNKE